MRRRLACLADEFAFVLFIVTFLTYTKTTTVFLYDSILLGLLLLEFFLFVIFFFTDCFAICYTLKLSLIFFTINMSEILEKIISKQPFLKRNYEAFASSPIHLGYNREFLAVLLKFTIFVLMPWILIGGINTLSTIRTFLPFFFLIRSSLSFFCLRNRIIHTHSSFIIFPTYNMLIIISKIW